MMDRGDKIVALDQIRGIVQQYQDHGLKVVQCSGVFNVTHFGHLEYFDWARALGDKLIVSVNSDRALRELRGENYNWTSQESRCRMLAALDVVDHVVIFDDSTAASIIRAVHPNIFVKGADYRHSLPEDEIQALSECDVELVFKDLVKDKGKEDGDKASASTMARTEGLLLRKYVERFATLKLAVVGDFALDVYSYGTVRRMSREAPVPIMTRDAHIPGDTVLGQAGNCVLNVHALGAEVIPIGAIGDDNTGVEIRKLLCKEQINTNALQVVQGFVTPRKERIFAHNVNALSQQVTRMDNDEGPANLNTAAKERLMSNVGYALEVCDGLIFSDYGYGLCAPDLVAAIITDCRAHNVPVVADSRYAIGNYHDILAAMPSEAEVAPFLNQEITDNNIGSIVSSLRQELGLTYAVVTRGSKGMVLADGEQIISFSGKRDVVDATGAGDTALALFTMALLSGASAQEAAQLSTTGVAITLMQKGTCLLTRDELASHLQIGLI